MRIFVEKRKGFDVEAGGEEAEIVVPDGVAVVVAGGHGGDFDAFGIRGGADDGSLGQIVHGGLVGELAGFKTVGAQLGEFRLRLGGIFDAYKSTQFHGNTSL